MDSIVCRKTAAWAASLTVLAGCTTVPPDLGRGDVDTLVTERGLPAADREAPLAELIEDLTAKPLTAESTVRIALLNNAEVGRAYASLGLGAADLYEAGRMSNPTFEASVLDPDESGEKDLLTFGLAVSFTDLITLPARSRLAKAEFAALKQSVGGDIFAAATEAEQRYYRFIGAKQVAVLRAQIARAGSLSAELAQRFYDAGNISARELALEKAAASEARLEALEAEAEAFGARTELANHLGLPVAGGWDAPPQLKVPPGDDGDLPELLERARANRLDLAAARIEAEVIADRLGVTRWSRWLGELEVGAERERETDGAELTGPTLAWEVPIFNQHRDALLRLDAELVGALVDLKQTELEVENSVRLAYGALQKRRAKVSEYQQTLLPQRQQSTARAQEEVNFMLIGVFELISIKQEEYDAYQGYLETLRDYWLARADLAQAVGHALPASTGSATLDVEDLLQPAPGMDHSQHDGMDHSEHDSMDHDSHGGSQ